MAKNRQTPQNPDERQILTKVHQLRSATAKTFQEKWDAAKENARFNRLLQWSDTQLQKFTNDKRVPYVLDYTSSVMNTYMGLQRDQRTDITYIPPSTSLEVGADPNEIRIEVLNFIKDTVLRTNHFQSLESDIFQDGIIEKAGFIGYEWSTFKNPLGNLNMFRIPQRQMSWDLNRREYSLHESQWVSRTRLYDKKALALKFPDYKDLIMRLQVNSSFFDQLWLDETYFKQIVYFDLDAVALIEFYEKDYKDKFYLFDTRSEDYKDEYFDTRKDAEKKIRELKKMHEQQIVPLLEQNGIQAPEFSLDVKRRQKLIIRKSEVIHDMVVTGEEETDLVKVPYDAYYPYWEDGEWWAVMDTFKDAQRFINKTFAMVDHQMSTGSHGLLLIDDSVPEPLAKEVSDLWSTTGGAKRVPDAKNNFNFVPPQSFDPRLLSAMDVAIVNLEKKAGGGNFLGHRESAGESGLAIEKRVEQGSLASFIVYDNLSRWKQMVGEQVAWYITTYMTASQKVRIEGKELTQLAQEHFPQWFQNVGIQKNVGYITINTGEHNTIEGLEVDTIVDEAKHSVMKNQRTLAQLSVLMQSSPTLANTIPPSVIIQLTDMPESMKMKAQEESQKLMEMEMQKAQAEMNKPPTVTASLKDIENLPLEVQQQFMAKFFGIMMQDGTKDPNAVKDIKTLHDISMSQQDLDFKKQKHNDQMAMKGLETMVNANVEIHKANKEKSNGEASRV